MSNFADNHVPKIEMMRSRCISNKLKRTYQTNPHHKLLVNCYNLGNIMYWYQFQCHQGCRISFQIEGLIIGQWIKSDFAI